MASVFDDILLRGVRAGELPARNAASREWFRDVAQSTSRGKVSPGKILSAKDKLVSGPSVGSMYHFIYDPKLKATLPYYDKFPLIFMVSGAAGGFYGLNLHYLPIELRAKLMDGLYSITNNQKYDDSTRIAMSYSILKKASKFRYFKPTFKHYLADHVKSMFFYVSPSEWDIALTLPTQRFEKANKGKVWSDSRNTI